MSPVGELIDAHGEGRRRAVFHARRGARDVLEVGFAALRAHHIVGIDRCPVLARSLDGAIKAAWAVAEALAPERKPLDIQVTASEAGIDMDVRGSGPLNAARMSALAKIADAHRLARLTRHGELIAQRGDADGDNGKGADRSAAWIVSAGDRGRRTDACGARLRPHRQGQNRGRSVLRARTLRAQACGARPRRGLRCRCGCGRSAEGRNAAATQGLKPIEAEARDLFRRPLVAPELKRVDAVVFDPPRQGAEAQSRELAKSAVPLVIAVSCNAATFARDVKILAEGGYRLTGVTPVDQFRYSAHVEIVARLSRR